MSFDQSSIMLEANGVAKRFGKVVALREASLRVHAGEIIALMGANGAGKSTFVKILTGALRFDSGEIKLAGEATKFSGPISARKAGIMPIYQEPSLIPDLTVEDNLRLIGAPVDPFQHWMAELGIADLAMDDRIGELPLATLRIMDLAATLAQDPKVMMLDEMTAALPSDLVERVLTVIRSEADRGRAIIYISHRFPEIARVCNRAWVLRDGKTVGNHAIEPGIEETIVQEMLGEIPQRAPQASASLSRHERDTRPPRLAARDLSAGHKLTGVSFNVRQGEVLGVVALEGQGQEELFELLAGLRRPTSGSIEIDGRATMFRHPADAINAGVKFVPGDRKDALLMQRSVHENIALSQIARPQRWGWIDAKREAAEVEGAVEKLQIDMRARDQVQRLSGGNQQKVTIARWVATGVDTLLLFDPTRGIDVRTKHQIYPLVRELAAQGSAVLFYSSELAEIPLTCDRAIVLFGGRVVDVIDAADADEANLMRAAYGLTAGERRDAMREAGA